MPRTNDRSSFTAMHYACHGGFFDCVVTLLQHGSDPNQLNNENMAPLDIVCESGFYICIGPVSRLFSTFIYHYQYSKADQWRSRCRKD